jgi:alanine-synthesizing transaminase
VAREHEIWVIHDLAYAEIAFDGYQAPSKVIGTVNRKN